MVFDNCFSRAGAKPPCGDQLLMLREEVSGASSPVSSGTFVTLSAFGFVAYIERVCRLSTAALALCYGNFCNADKWVPMDHLFWQLQSCTCSGDGIQFAIVIVYFRPIPFEHCFAFAM